MLSTTPHQVRAQLAEAVDAYRATANIGALLDRITAIADAADPNVLADAVEPWRMMPEVAGPIYERIIDARPDDARAHVILANAYWMAGRGAEQVATLASRAIAIDPDERGAWHLWALAEPDLRSRVERWRQVTTRFPNDQLAHATLADNAASLASTEHDREALDLAIATYTHLRASAQRPEERAALDSAIETLRGWKI